MERKNIHVVFSDLSKQKEKHPYVFFRPKKKERKNIHVLSSGLSK
jgi:hypothetical protein